MNTVWTKHVVNHCLFKIQPSTAYRVYLSHSAWLDFEKQFHYFIMILSGSVMYRDHVFLLEDTYISIQYNVHSTIAQARVPVDLTRLNATSS